jgi:F420-dependent oxidoreductase-like protein
MRIAVNGNRFVRPGDLAALRGHASEAAAAGYGGYWLAQDPLGSLDALSALAAIAPQAPGLELGTAVVPMWPRHPAALAAQALTVDQATEGRLTLGVGLSHPATMRMLGIESTGPADFAREYLEILVGLLRGEAVDVSGERLGCHTTYLRVRDDSPSVLVAALGPRMLDLAGRLTDGTIVTWTGPKTFRDHIRPRLDAAADAAGRDRPRVVALVSIAVTDDPAPARDAVDSWFAAHGETPSYAANLEREGASRPADVQAVGSEEQVRARLAEYAAAGVDDLVVGEAALTPDDAARTRALCTELARSGVG